MSEYVNEGLESLQPVKNKVGLVLGLPLNRKTVRREWAHAMMTIAWPVGITVMHCVVTDKPVSDARNIICKQALEVGAKYIWFVDDDTVPPCTAIRLLTYQLDQHPDAILCGGIYCSKTNPAQPMVFRELGMGSDWDWKAGTVFECAGIGTGCMLVRTEYLNDIPEPWFRTIDVAVEGNSTHHVGITDDLYFCDKASKAGFKLLAHGGVLCHHWDTENGILYSLPKDSRPFQKEESFASAGLTLVDWKSKLDQLETQKGK